MLIRAQDAKDYRLHDRHASRGDIVACPEDFRYALVSPPVGPKKFKCSLDSNAASFY
jgi:hypothetical protein